MHKSNLLKTTVLASLLISMNAQAFEIGKQPTTAYATITSATLSAKEGARKPVVLMNIKLSKKEQQSITETVHSSTLSAPSASDAKLPAQVNLGMNHVPVLDQGQHGACVTFATTAALDAQLNLGGDYISQLCHLELDSYLAKNGYGQDGWEGSFGPTVLHQIERFGYVSQEKQKSGACAGVTTYSLYNQKDQGKPMSLESFKAVSENSTVIDEEGKVQLNWTWTPIMSTFDRVIANLKNVDVSKAALIEVKKSLNSGNRVTIGTLLFSAPECNGITCATYKKRNDTWSVTNAIKNTMQLEGGHEMVIIGYDDNAVVTDNDGVTHKGVLTLRNSWGPSVGDKGNYYMTYEYFIAFATEAQKIITNA